MLSRGIELLKNYADTPLGDRATELLKICQDKIATHWWDALVSATFGVFMLGLAVMLVLLYAGVPIVGS
jgi:hypothetical protein